MKITKIALFYKGSNAPFVVDKELAKAYKLGLDEDLFFIQIC